MSEYNPINEQFKKQYEEALIHGAYRAEQTVNAAWKAINLFEEFTGHMDFTALFSIEENNQDFKSVTSEELIAELGRRTQI